MYMQQTQNYQLSQWESTDRVLMADFNNDNAKVEAALTALAGADTAEQQARAAQDTALQQQISQLKASMPVVKLGDFQVAPQSTRLDMDVSQIDLTEYAEIRLMTYFGCGTSGISLTYNQAPGVDEITQSSDVLCTLQVASDFARYKSLVRLLPYAGVLHCVTERYTESSNAILSCRENLLDVADIQSLQFITSGGVFNASSRVVGSVKDFSQNGLQTLA